MAYVEPGSLVINPNVIEAGQSTKVKCTMSLDATDWLFPLGATGTVSFYAKKSGEALYRLVGSERFDTKYGFDLITTLTFSSVGQYTIAAADARWDVNTDDQNKTATGQLVVMEPVASKLPGADAFGTSEQNIIPGIPNEYLLIGSVALGGLAIVAILMAGRKHEPALSAPSGG